MLPQDPHEIFSPEWLDRHFSTQRSTDFFEALYGNADDAAFDIKLAFIGAVEEQLNFEFRLIQRPEKCLACNLTYGLPNVFTRHPVINIPGLVADVALALDVPADRLQWKLGLTEAGRSDLHTIPLTLTIRPE